MLTKADASEIGAFILRQSRFSTGHIIPAPEPTLTASAQRFFPPNRPRNCQGRG